MIQEGKFGAFFNCIKCGNMNLKKVLDMNSERINSKDITVKNNRNTTIRPSTTKITRKKEKSKQRNETIRSDDPRYF